MSVTSVLTDGASAAGATPAGAAAAGWGSVHEEAHKWNVFPTWVSRPSAPGSLGAARMRVQPNSRRGAEMACIQSCRLSMRPLLRAAKRSACRFLRRFRLARAVEGDRLANERLEGGLVNVFSFVDVDRATCVSIETRVKETGRILQRRALGEGKLHDLLVGFARADDPVVRPNRSAHPLPLLDDLRVCFLDELAHSAEGFAAPVPEFGDSFRDELRCRLALARARLFHVLILEVPDIFNCTSPTIESTWVQRVRVPGDPVHVLRPRTGEFV